jgi:2-polyprenyl-3-methyl-5-hydroxy-6-metoxy-1,4-benzoquinol methylase
VNQRVVDENAVRERIEELRPWYQNIQLGNGISTKDLRGDSDIFSAVDIPRPTWELIVEHLGALEGRRVLDIGCNAGYMSFECKKLGAAYVLGIDSDLGATTSFIAQAEFCRDVLGLDVEFRRQSMFDEIGEAPFDVVLFAGVLYHLENWADALDRLSELVVSETGIVVVETASEPRTQTGYAGKGYHGDTTTFFVPSPRVLTALLEERGFRIRVFRDLGVRALAFCSVA